MFRRYIANPIPPEFHDISNATERSLLEFDQFVTFGVDPGFVPEKIGQWEKEAVISDWFYDEFLGIKNIATSVAIYRQKDSKGNFIKDPNNKIIINIQNGKGYMHLTTHF